MGATSSGLDPLETRVVEHVFALQPMYAVSLGLHDYDGRTPDLSVAATERWAGVADGLLGELRAIPESSLAASRRADRLLLRLLLEGPLFDLRVSRDLDRNPMSFVGSVSLTAYLVREYGTPAARVRALVQTLEAVPRILEDGRRRLEARLPRPFIELALAMGDGLPSHFGEAEEFAEKAGLAGPVRAARASAEAAVREFVGWLRSDALPRATDEFALGPERYQRLLFVREGIERPFDEVRGAGEADLARNQARLAEIARAQRSTPSDLLGRLGDDHPSATELIPAAAGMVEDARRFVIDQELASVPEPVSVRVEPTPLWGRALSTASMNSPGPFDSGAEGVYYVTPVDPHWTETQQEEWLRSLNRAMLRNTTIHEVYPGHYLQFLHFRAASGSLARKVYLSSSFVEGWAHYTEQLAVEAGFGPAGSPAELAELKDALLRDGRLLVSVGLHTAGWSLEKATEFLQREAHLERLEAEREAIRGTYNPEYFCYTLGKLAILEARAAWLDSVYGGNLKRFHDRLLGLGAPPVGLLRELLGPIPTSAV